ncbi:TPA: restriction endonuclease subunit S [Klebsiella aerogenes]|uniref:restriction endonuclease subunit S n=1 Tax=Klebsiella aerogenes TaxID=548 RepID=UPI00063CE27F|nr:restriction endonuclease subunit S [Klebsiella aerogenes]ELI7172218.1 restriction endonuclease subunit S [Klebsiella aerogenes]KLE47011.1 hypothetical protein YA13_07630 [Klebsiella aerogenes]KZQ72164.1 hypothetical protein A3N56_00610 [Klebsiella aerogenes]HDF5707839.1 restriction endonuclease subunit S [Klebsiella variicola]
MVPKGWLVKPFNTIAYLGNGQVDPKIEPYCSMIHIGPENVISDTGQLIDLKKCSELGLISGKYEFDEKAIVYSKIRPNLNKVCYPKFRGVCSADMYPIWVGDDIDINYLFQYMLGPGFYKTAVSMSMRTGMPKINRADLNTVPIIIPTMVEQKKIVDILQVWDESISLVDKMLDNSKNIKKALIQQLLTAKRRFSGYDGDWIKVKIGDVLKEVKRPVIWSDDVDYKLLSVKRRSEGVVLREVLHGSKILTKKMNLAKHGDFLVSKMQVLHGATGLVPKNLDGCHVSDSYISLVSKYPDKFDIEFFSWYSQQKFMYHKAYLCSYGVHIEKMTFNFNMYLKEYISIPPTLNEQKAIVNALNTASQEIDNLKVQLKNLKQEKKALMQQLLTGRLRVKVEAA